MFPLWSLPYFEGSWNHYSSYSSCIVLGLSLCFAYVIRTQSQKKWFHISLFLMSLVSAALGARLFHVFFERPLYFSTHIHEVLGRADGLTFYGALLAVLFFLSAVFRVFRLNQQERTSILNFAALAGAFMYGLGRLGCFLKGCCWGKVTDLPWAVQYFHPESSMKAWGVPVHPVQLYESALGFGVFLILYFRSRIKNRTAQLLPWFLFLLALGRLMTETFRGDSYRVSNLLWSLSLTQWLSLFIIIIVIVGVLGFWSLGGNQREIFSKKLQFSRVIPLFFFCLLFSCRDLPAPPSTQHYRVEDTIADSSADVIRIHPTKTTGKKGYRPKLRRNLVFVAIDPDIQFSGVEGKTLLHRIQNEYHSRKLSPVPVRLEELAWWMYFPSIRHRYERVIRVRHDRFSYSHLVEILSYLEARQEKYDLLLLAHGIDNVIFASDRNQPEENLTYQNLPHLSAQISRRLGRPDSPLQYLDLVMSQSCSGWSLRWEFADLGARQFIAFEGLTRNFFYFEFLMKSLAKSPDDYEAWRDANFKLKSRLLQSELHRRAVLEGIQKAQALDEGFSFEKYNDIDEYIAELAMPSYFALHADGNHQEEAWLNSPR